MIFNLDFDNNTILSCFFFFFFIIDLYFLIPAIITQISNSTAELVMHAAVPSKEAKVEMKIHSVTVETKINKRSKQLNRPPPP